MSVWETRREGVYEHVLILCFYLMNTRMHLLNAKQDTPTNTERERERERKQWQLSSEENSFVKSSNKVYKIKQEWNV